MCISEFESLSTKFRAGEHVCMSLCECGFMWVRVGTVLPANQHIGCHVFSQLGKNYFLAENDLMKLFIKCKALKQTFILTVFFTI